MMKLLLLSALLPYAWYHPEEVALYNARFTLLQTEHAGLPVECKPYHEDLYRCTGMTDEVWVRLLCYSDEWPWECEMTTVSRKTAVPKWMHRRIGSP